MSSRSQRGRSVQKQTNPMQIFYIALALVAVVGVAVVLIVTLGGGGPNAARTTPTSAVAPAKPVAQLPLDSFPSKGQASAPVTVVEYSDFQCPACRYYATTDGPAIDKEFVESGKVRFIYHDFPLPQHANAIVAAEAARCAADQSAFWPMHDKLFQSQPEWDRLDNAKAQATFANYAAALNLNKATFEQCQSSGKHRQTILQAQADSNTAQINATPTFVIDGKEYSIDTLRDGILAALGGK